MGKKWRLLPYCFDLLYSVKWEHELVKEMQRAAELAALMEQEGLMIENGKVVKDDRYDR